MFITSKSRYFEVTQNLFFTTNDSNQICLILAVQLLSSKLLSEKSYINTGADLGGGGRTRFFPQGFDPLPTQRVPPPPRLDLHKPKMLVLQFPTPKMLILQFHTSNVWENASHTIFLQFQKIIEKRFELISAAI